MKCTGCEHEEHEGLCLAGEDCGCGVATRRDPYPGTLTGLDSRLTDLENQGRRSEDQGKRTEEQAKETHDLLRRMEDNINEVIYTHTREIRALQQKQREFDDELATQRKAHRELARRVAPLLPPIPRGDPPDGERGNEAA